MAITQIKGSNIADGTVVAADVADDAVTTAKILDANVTDAKIAGMAASKLTGTVPVAGIDGSPDTNNTATGPQTNTFASGYTASITDLVVLGNASKWVEADANATATSIGLLGIALESKNDTQLMNVALSGSFIYGAGWSWTPGAPLYIGNILGAMVEAKPTGTGDIVRTVGYAVTPTVVFFNPSSDYVTLV
jgi:hypothetical protein